MLFRTLLKRAAAVIAVVALALGALPTTADAQSNPAGRYLNVGSFTNAGNAERARAIFVNAGLTNAVTRARVDQIIVNGVIYHRVRIGPFYSDADAARALNEAYANGMKDAHLKPASSKTVTAGGASYDPNLSTATSPKSISAPSFTYVQIGAFNDLAAATALLNRARAADGALDGVIHSIGRRGGAVHRVMVGPFATEAAASAAFARLRTVGVVASANTSRSTTVASTSKISTANISTSSINTKSATNLFVHIGSYSDPSNAHKAVDRLRNAGVDAELKTVVVNGGLMYRVTFGPTAKPEVAGNVLAAAHIMGYKDATLVRAD